MRTYIVRIILAVLTAILAINLWTGAPLFAIWVGSRVQKGTGLTMSTVIVVMAVLAASVALLVFLLTRVEAAYKTVTGQETARRTSPWLRSMRGERPELASQQGLTGFEKGLTAAVVLGVVVFEGWFFLFAGSSIG
jgi:hypothetical protein